jgi:ABC-type sugar transport system substrate-binding protein
MFRKSVIFLTALLAVVGLVALAACGGDEEEAAPTEPAATTAAAGETAEATTEAAPEDTGAAATEEAAPATGDVQEVVNHVFLTDQISASDLDPTIVQTLELASAELSEEDKALALKCWQQETCETGRGELVVGIADGFGDNTWREFTKMEIILQALANPEVAQIIYTNAHGDLAQAQSNFRSLTSQGADLIVGYFDHGDAMLPVMREAMAAGVPVVPYVGGVLGATAGDTVLTVVNPDLCEVGKEMVRTAVEALGDSGNIVYLTGTPGNPQGQAWQSCADEELAQHPGFEVVAKADTQWTQEGALQAMSGILGQGTQVDAIFYDYANATRGVVRAYEQAGVEIPLIVTWTEDNELFGQWEELQPSNPNFQIYYTNSVNWPSRVALQAAINSLQGEEVPEAIIYPQPFVLLEEGVYDPSKPGEFGASTLVPEDLIDQMF